MRHFKILAFVVALFAAGFGIALVSTLKPGATTSGTPLIGGPFSLIDTHGQRVTDQSFRGKLMLVFFGYTNCPDVCPTELQTFSQVLDKLGPDAGKVVPIFVTVDPERDTPQVLASYVGNFGPRIVALTGTSEEVAAAAKAYRIFYSKAGTGPDYSVDHSAFTYLMDGEGKYLTHFTLETTPEKMVDVIKKHLAQDKSA